MHLGNLFGAIRPFVELTKQEKEADFFLFLANMHGLTVIHDATTLRNYSLTILKLYKALGVDTSRVYIYNPADIPGHAQLNWVLTCLTIMGTMERMHSYKDALAKGKAGEVSVGTFCYPILMASDILLYDANYIPVGEDQFQHIELTRNLAERFNRKFGEVFTVPEDTRHQVEFMGSGKGVRIRDLVDPTKKMSKSTAGENSKIMLSDEPKRAAKKIMSATTDSFGEIQFDFATRPGISNLLQIEALISGRPLDDVIAQWSGKTQYGELKKTVAASVERLLTEFQDKLSAIKDSDVLPLLETGEAYANAKASAKLQTVYKQIGLMA